jgi:hypothetical protein
MKRLLYGFILAGAGLILCRDAVNIALADTQPVVYATIQR